MKAAHSTEKTDSQTDSKIIRTFGEIFADGSVVEPVSSATCDKLDLLLWNGKKTLIAPQIEHGGRIYQAQELDGSILGAMRFARKPARYGTIRKLFTELASVFEKFLAFSKSEAERTAFWVITTWFCDCLSSPLSLSVSGREMGRAIALFRLLHCVSRHALMITGVTQAGFLSLPLRLHPTLLVNQPSLPRKIQNLWLESNYRGLLILGNRGTVLEAISSKAVFTGMEVSAQPGGPEALHLYLLPVDAELPLLDERALNEIADYFLPRFLLYRLHHLQKVRESRFSVSDLRLPTRELARELGACIQGDPDLALQVVPLLQPQDDDPFNQCNLDSAIIEILWPRLHSKAVDGTAMEIRIEKELTEDVNTFLLCCGENRQYSAVEVGKRVAQLELSRQRKNFGSVVLLDRGTGRRVHRLACSYGLRKNVPGCPDCEQGQVSAE